MKNFRVLLILIKIRYHKLILSKVIMTDWYDMQVLKSDVLSFPKRQPVWKNKERKSLTGGTELTAAYNKKRFVIHIMSGVMKWIHFLASSSLQCQRTLCYQHRWSMHGSGEEPGANCKQASLHTNESLRFRPLLSSDRFGSSVKMN